MGASVTFEFNSVNRGVANLHNGIYDISTAVSPSDNIRQQFWVSDKALYPIEFIAIHKPTTPPISAILKQNNVTFAALSENTFPFIDRFFAAHTDIKRYDVSSMQQGLKLVEADKMPYFLTYASGNDELTESQYQIDVIEKMPVHLVVSKQHPQGKALIDKINAALSLIVNS